MLKCFFIISLIYSNNSAWEGLNLTLLLYNSSNYVRTNEIKQKIYLPVPFDFPIKHVWPKFGKPWKDITFCLL